MGADEKERNMVMRRVEVEIDEWMDGLKEWMG